MNAIEQMMQAFGAGAARDITAIFGSTAAAESSAGDFANQFAESLEKSHEPVSSSESPWRLTSTAALEGLTLEGSEEKLEGGLEGVLANAYQPTIDTIISAANDGLSNGEIDLSAAASALQGIPGLQLIQLTGAELSEMIESGQLQSVGGTLPNLDALENDVFLFAAGTSANQPFRLLPLAQLEPLVTPDAAAQATTGTEAIQAAKATVADVAAKATVADVAAKATVADVAVNAAGSAASEELTDQVITDQATAAAKSTTNETFKLVEDPKAVEANGAQVNAAKQAAAQQKAQAEQAALQQQAQQKGQNAGSGTAQQTAAADQQAAAAGALSAAASSASTSGISAKNDASNSEQKTSTKNTATAQQTAQQSTQSAPITWTPEQAAGATDGSMLSSEAFSGGLSGLRGESSFMNAMSLMGGKASPELAAHLAKQINMQVTRAVNNGTQEFNMRLNPSELGSLKIKMSFTDSGKVSAQVLVERPETLELLQREVRGIERAIEAGGHKVGSEGISFNLDQGDGQSAGKAFAEAAQKEQHADKMSADSDAGGNEGAFEGDAESDDLTNLAVLEEILSRVSPETGLDVRV